jgi:hypothetical protein
MNQPEAPIPPRPEPLVEGVDYYIENGYWVFTERYLLKRGKCCKCGCRHCPFRKRDGNFSRRIRRSGD